MSDVVGCNNLLATYCKNDMVILSIVSNFHPLLKTWCSRQPSLCQTDYWSCISYNTLVWSDMSPPIFIERNELNPILTFDNDYKKLGWTVHMILYWDTFMLPHLRGNFKKTEWFCIKKNRNREFIINNRGRGKQS